MKELLLGEGLPVQDDAQLLTDPYVLLLLQLLLPLLLFVGFAKKRLLDEARLMQDHTLLRVSLPALWPAVWKKEPLFEKARPGSPWYGQSAHVDVDTFPRAVSRGVACPVRPSHGGALPARCARRRWSRGGEARWRRRNLGEAGPSRRSEVLFQVVEGCSLELAFCARQ